MFKFFKIDILSFELKLVIKFTYQNLKYRYFQNIFEPIVKSLFQSKLIVE